MKMDQLNEWEVHPINLTTEQIDHPLLVIRDFFDDDQLPDQLERLKEWRRCILSDEYFKGQKNSPAELLYFHQLNICLLEAAYLLKDGDRHLTLPLKEEKETWPNHPNNLNEAELIDPLLALTNIFKDHTLQQYRDMLYEWLEHGLSSKAANEFIETADLINVYENLQKLYTAAWLIHFRIQNDLDQQRFRLTDSPIIQPVVRVYHLDAAIKPSQKEQISGLISIIKHKIPTVEAILYLGSQPAAEHQLFLLVLTTDNEQQTALSLSNTIEESCRKITAVTALVHYSSAFIKALNEGNQFFKKALSCPVIYLSGDLLLPVAGPLFHLPNHDTAVQWERWHGQGKDFLKGAEYYLRINAYGAALFSMHQCVEYLLVAIIRVVLGYGLNVHNLSKLLSITRMFTNDLFIVFNFEDEQSAALFRMLKDAYIDVRYRDTFDPDITSLDTLYRVTKHFVETVEKVYERHLLSESL